MRRPHRCGRRSDFRSGQKRGRQAGSRGQRVGRREGERRRRGCRHRTRLREQHCEQRGGAGRRDCRPTLLPIARKEALGEERQVRRGLRRRGGKSAPPARPPAIPAAALSCTHRAGVKVFEHAQLHEEARQAGEAPLRLEARDALHTGLGLRAGRAGGTGGAGSPRRINARPHLQVERQGDEDEGEREGAHVAPREVALAHRVHGAPRGRHREDNVVGEAPDLPEGAGIVPRDGHALTPADTLSELRGKVG